MNKQKKNWSILYFIHSNNATILNWSKWNQSRDKNKKKIEEENSVCVYIEGTLIGDNVTFSFYLEFEKSFWLNDSFVCFFSDGELYVGTVADFSGMDPIIYRDPLQTEQYDSMSLNGKNPKLHLSIITPLYFLNDDYKFFFAFSFSTQLRQFDKQRWIRVFLLSRNRCRIYKLRKGNWFEFIIIINEKKRGEEFDIKKGSNFLSYIIYSVPL